MMVEGRESFTAVRSGLRILGWSLAASVALSVLSQVLWAVLLPVVSASRDYVFLSALSLCVRAGFTGASVATAIGAMRLARLPPVELTVLKGAGYRASPSVSRVRGQAGLGRIVGVLAWASIAVDIGTVLWTWVGRLFVKGDGAYYLSWLLSLGVTSVMAVLLALWFAGVARDFALRSSGPLPAIVIVLAVLRGAIAGFMALADIHFRPWSGWLNTAVWIGVQVCLLRLAFGTARDLAALSDGGPDLAPRTPFGA